MWPIGGVKWPILRDTPAYKIEPKLGRAHLHLEGRSCVLLRTSISVYKTIWCQNPEHHNLKNKAVKTSTISTHGRVEKYAQNFSRNTWKILRKLDMVWQTGSEPLNCRVHVYMVMNLRRPQSSGNSFPC
jgi:hypothetical protein